MNKNRYTQNSLKIKFFKVSLFFIGILAISSFGYYNVYGYGGGIYTTEAKLITSINVDLVISPNQSGVLIKSFDNESINVEVPSGLSESDSTYSLNKSLTPSNVNSGTKLTDSFELGAKDIEDNPIISLNDDINFSINFNQGLDGTNQYGVYEYNAISNTWNLNNTSVTNLAKDEITFNSNNLLPFAVFTFKDTVPSVIDVYLEPQVLGAVEEDYSKVSNLANKDKDIVEAVSKNESQSVKNNIKKTILSSVEDNILKLITNNYQVNDESKVVIENFINSGTVTTKRLGAGERGGVISSFAKIHNKLPETEEDWQDIIKIANGRWPSQLNAEAEQNTISNHFVKIYKRQPDLSDSHDNAAVTVITYGLRPAIRDVEREKNGIKIFESIYKYKPTSAVDWDIVRAISYSGAIR